MRKYIIAANWKMYKTDSETIKFLSEFIKKVDDVPEEREVVIAPPFTSLKTAYELIKGSKVKLAAQNMGWEVEGAYTGEISPLMLKDIGCEYVILGHSERREYAKEDDDLIARKVKLAIDNGLKPILCVGERLEEREAGNTFKVVSTQLRGGLKFIEDYTELVIAYEPVWAIGTGKTATPELAQEVHEFLRKELKTLFGDEKGDSIRIQYGGSVKPENVKELMSCADIDGALVGGASLKVDSFFKIAAF